MAELASRTDAPTERARLRRHAERGRYDAATAVWAGEIPLDLLAGEAIGDVVAPPLVPAPEYVTRYAGPR